MGKIRILEEEVYRKIAAGEVIERPASVVKELVENALDAGATRIRVELEEGGLASVKVKDDGEGMSADDLKLCWLPHATSKIRTAEDLLRITTYGFRGEALSSIAQVSRLSILTRPREAPHGFLLVVEFGREKEFKVAPSAYGTTVTVERLFSRHPARKAFLKGKRAELSKVAEVVKLFALARPDVSLSLVSDGREVLSFYAGSRKRVLSRILNISEGKFVERRFEKRFLRLELVLALPEASLKTSKALFVLVNGRPVRERRLVSAVTEALRGLLPPSRHPTGLLSLTLPPHLVDVNVHPAKLEVRFRNESEVYGFVKACCEKVFSPSVAAPRPSSEEAPPTLKPAVSKPESPYRVREEAPALFKEERRFPSAILRGTYAVFEAPEGLLVLDLHAAHEAVLFEELSARLNGSSRERLLFPGVLSLSPRAVEKVLEEKGVLEDLGFVLRISGPSEVVVEEVPAGVGIEAAEELQGLLEEQVSPESWRRRLLERLSCRLAKKSGEGFSPEEAAELLRKVKEKGIERCPHGRPVTVVITWDELEKRFKRRP